MLHSKMRPGKAYLKKISTLFQQPKDIHFFHSRIIATTGPDFSFVIGHNNTVGIFCLVILIAELVLRYVKKYYYVMLKCCLVQKDALMLVDVWIQ